MQSGNWVSRISRADEGSAYIAPTSGEPRCSLKVVANGPAYARVEPLPEPEPDLLGGQSIDDFVAELECEGYADDFARLRREDAEDRERRQGRTSLKTLRLRAGLSQTQLAARIGTHQSAIARWENDVAPNLEYVTLKKLATALNVDLNTLGSAIDG